MSDIHGLVTIQPIATDDTWPIRQVVLWPEKPMDFIKLTATTRRCISDYM